ncbi:UNVERIFIED_CONTAM: hypothetical protein Sradi_3743500 [Sesamum radiatum]|uniref:Retrotransposon Copia-like N-terminal domain-containing protein n=1 Tax=Sesamum radiatum TaxID=300843 RepID=A0AAW2PYL4_SESRA
MAESVSKSDLSLIPSNSSSPIIIQNESSIFPTSVILDETNYPLWSQLMEMLIGARNKSGYLTGAAKKPGPEDPAFSTWITENQKVKSWLIDSMSPTLMQRFIPPYSKRNMGSRNQNLL